MTKDNYQNIEKSFFFTKFKEILLNYKPLIIILVFCFILSLSQSNSLHNRLNFFMGYFFIFLSMFKFFDLNGFVDGFLTYDLVTKKFRLYGYVYPFIEFFLGVAYLVQFDPFLTNWITIIVMAVSGMGVLKSILSGQKIKCACLGAALNVPLSVVSIIESFGMGFMAVYKLFF